MKAEDFVNSPYSQRVQGEGSRNLYLHLKTNYCTVTGVVTFPTQASLQNKQVHPESYQKVVGTLIIFHVVPLCLPPGEQLLAVVGNIVTCQRRNCNLSLSPLSPSFLPEYTLLRAKHPATFSKENNHFEGPHLSPVQISLFPAPLFK